LHAGGQRGSQRGNNEQGLPEICFDYRYLAAPKGVEGKTDAGNNRPLAVI